MYLTNLIFLLKFLFFITNVIHVSFFTGHSHKCIHCQFTHLSTSHISAVLHYIRPIPHSIHPIFVLRASNSYVINHTCLVHVSPPADSPHLRAAHLTHTFLSYLHRSMVPYDMRGFHTAYTYT
jgi:hypothetical protein